MSRTCPPSSTCISTFSLPLIDGGTDADGASIFPVSSTDTVADFKSARVCHCTRFTSTSNPPPVFIERQ
ncbi:MAG: hypothetical protein GY822_21820 [Deltaproteobacteria bacterium]|nr:hypothetical protein [Deltaproteobacteria bacterium]